ncbi:hypothetical protein JK386_09490 [Nocardioides sp. zg-536]|uniref:Uncharacterized protein n=1 Tax=Nocardioides faecalis TaxID=2803858 RepID=A0A939BVN1_9ACTN|nr:hypothetical protein [Nocardioides faecalis]MBM9460136.1 hypothetical protein [Nocardioides faecalis]MBS4754234.1 hypothetical protein [Nocardioides faecalis]QVI60069.1 hypothetical protein KG111_07115 [Nocardioides faecalis]
MNQIEILFAFLGVVVTASQVWQARTAQKAADRLRLADDKRFALAICEPLATPEVHAILAKDDPTKDELSFLEARFALVDASAGLLSDSVTKEKSIGATIEASLRPAKDFLERNGGDPSTDAVDTKLGKVTDHTKYSWDGADAKLPKIVVVNRIARRWATDKGITCKEEFLASFEEELRAAVPGRAAELNRNGLLSEKAAKDYLPDGALVLDGVEYGVDWSCGFKNTRIGVEVHKPVIEYFKDKHQYPIVRR